MLLRKLADNYYGLYMVRIIDGITHNLSGPLQVLYIRSEQIEQGLEQLRGAPQSEGMTQVERLAGRMEEKIKSMSESLDELNNQMRHLTSPLIIEKRSEIGDVKINQVIEDCIFLLNADMFFKHNVKKTFSLDDDLPTLKGRRTDLCIIILNLVQNALEAMVDAQDKHFAIETSGQQDMVIIRVQDTVNTYTILSSQPRRAPSMMARLTNMQVSAFHLYLFCLRTTMEPLHVRAFLGRPPLPSKSPA
jgi:signal transduction histidine kinase